MITLEEKEKLIKDLESLRINVDSETYGDRSRTLEEIYTRTNEMLDQCIECVNSFYNNRTKQIKSTDDFMVKTFVDNMTMHELDDIMYSDTYPEDYNSISYPIYPGYKAFSDDNISEIYGCSDKPVESSFLG